MLPKAFLEKYPEYKGCKCYLFYVRESIDEHKGKPVGIIILTDTHIGWSLCNPVDKWDKVFGIRKAFYKMKEIDIGELKKEIVQRIRNIKLNKIKESYSLHLKYLCLSLSHIKDKFFV